VLCRHDASKEELYLSNARLREFRGQAMYKVPSMFLDELPQDANTVEAVDLSHHSGGSMAPTYWRGGSAASPRDGTTLGTARGRRASRSRTKTDSWSVSSSNTACMAGDKSST